MSLDEGRVYSVRMMVKPFQTVKKERKSDGTEYKFH
jgi:hypothetical protein